MNEDLNDILYDIDMQLYDEFNDKIATMNDYLGDVYSLRDVEEVENAQKGREIELLRIAIVKQQKEIEELEKNRKVSQNFAKIVATDYISKDKIKSKIEEIENYYRELYKQDNSPNEFLIGQDCLSKLSILQEVKQSLLEKE